MIATSSGWGAGLGLLAYLAVGLWIVAVVVLLTILFARAVRKS